MANLRMLPFVLLCSTMLACPGDDDGTAETTSDTTPTTTMMTTALTTDSTDSVAMTTTIGEDSTTVGPVSTDTGSSTMPDPDTSSGASTTAGVVSASATLEPRSGSTAMGTAVFTANGPDWSDLVVDLQGVMPPGTHALHIHEFPDCSAEDGTSTGDHWNPPGTMLGELGTLEIAEDGTGTFMKSDAWSIGTGAENDVVDHSIIIHLNPDGGPRIACGVIVLD